MRRILPVLFLSTLATGAQVNISVDGAAAGKPLKTVWSYFGYDEVNYTTLPEGKALLKDIVAMNADKPYIRTHFLLNSGDGTPTLKWGSTNVYTENAQGEAVYDWKLLDGIMDAIVSAGALPLVEIAFMPHDLSSKPDPYKISSTYVLDGGGFQPPKSYPKWSELIRQWALHSKARYPETIDAWLWEFWNEPNYDYWLGTHAEHFKTYDFAEQGLHAALPNALLGGPETGGVAASFMREFFDHTSKGVNGATGKVGTKVDMVTFHAKGGVGMNGPNIRMNLGNQLALHRSGFAVSAAYPEYKDKPIVIGEADPDGCAACPATSKPANYYRNSVAYAAYEAAMMKHTLDLADKAGVNLKGIVTWAWTFPGSEYFFGYRVLSTNGIHLPVLQAFKMLGKMKGTRLPLTSDGALGTDAIIADKVLGKPDIDGLACRNGNQIQTLIWSYHDDLIPAAASDVRLKVALPADFPAPVKVTHYRLDSTHSNAYTEWLKAGKPQKPTADQVARMKAAMALETLEPAKTVSPVNQAVTLDFALPRHGLSLVIVEGGSPTGLRLPKDNARKSQTHVRTWLRKGTGGDAHGAADARGRWLPSQPADAAKAAGPAH